jgi:hypothetical protein
MADNFFGFKHGKIKRNWTDQLFSKYIRDRSDWTCQNPKCGKTFNRDDGKESRKLHCCHLGYGRGHIPTRWNEYNCLALCGGCHLWTDQHPMRAIWLINQHFTIEQIMFVKDQYKDKRSSRINKEFELIERERIKILIKGMETEGING